ncbi:MAG: hypothetical protein ACTHL1_07630 [Burkholderiaceae bacterium]
MKSTLRTFASCIGLAAVLGGCAVYEPQPIYRATTEVRPLAVETYPQNPVYVAPAPVYVEPAPVYVTPPITFGLNFWSGPSHWHGYGHPWGHGHSWGRGRW